MTSSLTFRGASSSTSPAHQCTYDVFLSFKGEDTRRNFISLLYDALDRRGIKTYIGDEQPRRGENISSVLLKAIEESRTLVVVLSENYASSSSCLDELQKILKYRETKGQIVIPVYYKVNPLDVRHQRNNFGEAFAELEKRFKDDLIKVHGWKAALSQVANFAGWHLENHRNEAQFIDAIVRGIAYDADKIAKYVAKHPVAIESIVQMLDSSSSPSRVGIESPAQVPDSSSSQSPVGIESPPQVPDSSSSPSPVGIESLVHVPNSSSSPAQVPDSSSSQSPVGIESPVYVPDSSSSPAQVPDSSSSQSPVGIESPAQVPNSSSQSPGGIESPPQVPDSSSSPSPVGIESPVHVLDLSSSHAQVPDSSSSPSPVGIESLVHVPDSSSSPAQVPDSSSSPSPESPEQGPDSASSPSPDGIESPAQVPDSSNSPSGNGEQGSNPSISSEGIILFLIASVIGLLQLNDLFKTYPANMWIAEAALVMFCLSYATMTRIDGTHWARCSRTINSFRVLSGTLVLASLSSIQLPHRIWWLFFAIWALLGFIFVAYTWRSHSRVDGRDDVEMGQMIPLIRPTMCLTLVENSPDAAHS